MPEKRPNSSNHIQTDSIVANESLDGEQPPQNLDNDNQLSSSSTIPFKEEIVQLDNHESGLSDESSGYPSVWHLSANTATTSVGFSVDNAVVRDIAPFATVVVIVIVVVFMVLFRD